MALLVSQDRRHLFETPWMKRSVLIALGGQLSSKLLTIPAAVYRKKYEEKCSFCYGSAVIYSITYRLGNISYFSLFGKIF